MSKKITKIMSVVLALMMVCSLLPMSAMAAENDTYTVTFAPGTLCDYTGEGDNPTRTYDGTGEFLLPDPATLHLDGRNEEFVFQGWTLEGGDGTVYEADADVANLITGNVTFLANYVAVVTFAPGNLCLYTGEGAYPTSTYAGTGEFLLPDPADVDLVGRQDNFVFSGWSLEGSMDDRLYPIGTDVASLITSNVTFLANFEEPAAPDTVTYTISAGSIKGTTYNRDQVRGPIPAQ